MDKHWLITYQQREYGRELWQIANCATSKSPAQWLLDACAKCATVLLFAVEITDDECHLIQNNI
jgi:hypothetical protein